MTTRAALVWVAVAMSTTGCSAIDDFGRFRFTADGAYDDGGSLDAAVGAIGEPCPTASCPTGLTCFMHAGAATLPDGLCSRTCDPSLGDCPPGSECATVEGVSLCLARCDPSTGRTCRTGYSCCMAKLVVQGPGACSPTGSNFCGN